MKILFSILVLLISFSLNAKEERTCDDLIKSIKNINLANLEQRLEDDDKDFADMQAGKVRKNYSFGFHLNPVIEENGFLIEGTIYNSPASKRVFSRNTYLYSIDDLILNRENLYNYLIDIIRKEKYSLAFYSTKIFQENELKLISKKISEVLKISFDDVYNKVSEKGKFRWIKRNITREEYLKLKSINLKYYGINNFIEKNEYVHLPNLEKPSYGIFKERKKHFDGNNKLKSILSYKLNDVGLVITEVVDESPIWKAGLREGDVITRIVFKDIENSIFFSDIHSDGTILTNRKSNNDMEILKLEENLEKSIDSNSDITIRWLKQQDAEFLIKKINSKSNNKNFAILNDDEIKKIKLINTNISPSMVTIPKSNFYFYDIVKHLLETEKAKESNFQIGYYLNGKWMKGFDAIMLSEKDLVESKNINISLYGVINEIKEKENNYSAAVSYEFLYSDKLMHWHLYQDGFNHSLLCDYSNNEIENSWFLFPKLNISSLDTRTETVNESISYNPDISSESVNIKKQYLGVAKWGKYNDFREFPFDTLNLPITLTNDYHYLYNFKIDETILDENLLEDHQGPMQDWYLLNVKYYDEISDDQRQDLIISSEYAREYNYYILKIIIPIILILIVCWSVFWIDISQIESRLTISVVCLLALIAYNVIVAESLPKIGYATIMDYIILSSYILGALSTLLTVIFYNFHIRQYNFMRVEQLTRISLPILYVIIVYSIIDYNIERLDSRVIGQFILGIFNF